MLAPPTQTLADSGSEFTQTTVVIDSVPFLIFVPKRTSAAAEAQREIVILGRCAHEKCQRVIPLTRKFCDNNDLCKNAHHNLLRKLGDTLLQDPKQLPLK